MRRDEPVAGRRPGRRGRCSTRSAAWCRSTTWATGRRVRSPTARCSTSAATGCGTIATPHVPHGWEAQVLFDETTGTLFCGDLFTQRRRRRRRSCTTPTSSSPRSTPRTCSAPPRSPRHGADHPRRWPTSSPARWRSCTARRSPATARQALLDLADAYEARFAAAAVGGLMITAARWARSRARGARARRGRDRLDGRAAGRPDPRGVGAADSLPGLGRPRDGRTCSA